MKNECTKINGIKKVINPIPNFKTVMTACDKKRNYCFFEIWAKQTGKDTYEPNRVKHGEDELAAMCIEKDDLGMSPSSVGLIESRRRYISGDVFCKKKDSYKL